MHYKNGREVKVGDWVVGVGHNTHGYVVCGYVIETMPKQGNCNIKFLRWRVDRFTEEGNPVTLPIGHPHNHPIEDYGDAEQFIRADDGLRMITAIETSGSWDAPAFAIKLYDH